jgi:hypothetical protein
MDGRPRIRNSGWKCWSVARVWCSRQRHLLALRNPNAHYWEDTPPVWRLGAMPAACQPRYRTANNPARLPCKHIHPSLLPLHRVRACHFYPLHTRAGRHDLLRLLHIFYVSTACAAAVHRIASLLAHLPRLVVAPAPVLHQTLICPGRSYPSTLRVAELPTRPCDTHLLQSAAPPTA